MLLQNIYIKVYTNNKINKSGDFFEPEYFQHLMVFLLENVGCNYSKILINCQHIVNRHITTKNHPHFTAAWQNGTKLTLTILLVSHFLARLATQKKVFTTKTSSLRNEESMWDICYCCLPQ